MDARLDYGSSEILQKFVKHINSAGAAVPRGTLPVATLTSNPQRTSGRPAGAHVRLLDDPAPPPAGR